jgi:uncharacterized protein YqjF (DUF2071 family)
MHCETLSIEKPNETEIGEAARKRLLSVWGEPLFLADWLRPVFIHYEVTAAELQPSVPFELDLREGKAYVSLVAFTMRGMRPFYGGRLAAWLCKPIATNEYLNVRTYVRHRGEPGIYFLTEWKYNPFSVRLGPMTGGLPYRVGTLTYQHRDEEGVLKGEVREKGLEAALRYEATLSYGKNQSLLTSAATGSLDEFLLERYTAFTAHKGKRRFFRIWHSAWRQQAVPISVMDKSLIDGVWPWFSKATLVGGNYSPGARDVWMGRPHQFADARECYRRELV